MRIGIVLPATPAYSETFFINKIKGLQDSGFEVILFAGRKNKSFKLCKVVKSPPVYRFYPLMFIIAGFHLFFLILFFTRRVKKFFELEKNSRSNFREIFENLYINSHILRYNLDWLHFGFATMAIRSENVAKAIGAKMAVSLRGYDIAIYPLKKKNCYDLLWMRVDKVHTISDDLLNIARKYGLPPDKNYQKITPAIDVLRFCNSGINHRIDHSEKNKLKILSVARLHWTKGLVHTLEALAILNNEENIDFEYIIIGDGEEFENLVFTVHQLKLENRVKFLGKQTPDVVRQIMCDSDLYLQYSISEGFCNAVLEAQAMGLLCIVSDSGGLTENVLHGKTGWVVPKRNPDLLARQILEVINSDDETLNKIRTNAIQRVQKEFNLEKQWKEFIEFYTKN